MNVCEEFAGELIDSAEEMCANLKMHEIKEYGDNEVDDFVKSIKVLMHTIYNIHVCIDEKDRFTDIKHKDIIYKILKKESSMTDGYNSYYSSFDRKFMKIIDSETINYDSDRINIASNYSFIMGDLELRISKLKRRLKDKNSHKKMNGLYHLKLRDLKVLPESVMVVNYEETEFGQDAYNAVETFRVEDYLDCDIWEIRNRGGYHTIYVVETDRLYEKNKWVALGKF